MDQAADSTRTDDAEGSRPVTTSWPLVAAAGWLLPGLGYVLIGQRWRAYAGGGAVLALFALGLLIGGVRVVELPDLSAGVAPGSLLSLPWRLLGAVVGPLARQPWFAAQGLAGPVSVVAGYLGEAAARAGYPRGTARLNEIGTLYCAIAGMLNFVLILDAAARAAAAGDRADRADGAEGRR